MRHNVANSMPPPTPPPVTLCVISRFLIKSIVFEKIFQMSLAEKKADCIQRVIPLNLHIIVGWIFSLPLWIPAENKVKLKKLFNLNSKLRWKA